MKKLYIKKAIFFLLCIIIIKACWANESLNTIDNIRFGKNKKGLRIVLDMSPKVQYQVYSIKDPSIIKIRLFDTIIKDNLKKFKRPSDKFLKRFNMSQTNFRQVDLKISLAYGVPIDNVKFFKIKNPNRLVIDIYRNYKDIQSFHITKNILWKRLEKAAYGQYKLINQLFINFKSKDIKIDIGLAKNNGKKRQKVSSMVKSKGAIAGINGGYFARNGQNLCLIVKNKKIISPSIKRRPPRTAFCMNKKGKISFKRLLDKKGKLYDPKGRNHKGIILALGAGPRLISKNSIKITAKNEGLGKGGNNIENRRAGRAALGIDSKGRLLMLTISSFKNNHKEGIKLKELAKYLKSLNIKEAMNLDGGGSTALSILGTNVSKPPMAGRFQRPVTNSLLIFDKSPIRAPYNLIIEPNEIQIPADGVSERAIRIFVTDPKGKPVANNTVVNISSGVGLFKKKYHLTKNGVVNIQARSVKAPDIYKVKVECGPLRSYITIKIAPEKPTFLMGKAKKCIEEKFSGVIKKETPKNKTQKFIIKALVIDQYKNPLRSKVVNFSILEGEGEFNSENSFTKPNGVADTIFILKSQKAKIKLSSSELKDLIIQVAK